MTVQEFFDNHFNKFVEFNNDQYKNQCVDLVQTYIRDVLGLPPVWGNAKDIFYNASEKYFEKIVNHWWTIPKNGDIVCFGQAVGTYGHIAIIKSANLYNFVSFDENWPLNTLAHFQDHTYKGVIGFLRPKASGNSYTPQNLVFRVRVDKAGANVRTQPRLSAPLGGSQTLKRGDIFNATGVVYGDTYDGINTWYVSEKGNYVWSGGLTRI
jgi:surface antigen